MSDEPLPIPSQRAPNGRFLPGWKGGNGNPYGQRLLQLRTALYKSVTPEDIQEVMAAMVAAAKKGDVAAAKLALSYTVGEPKKCDIEEKPDYGSATDILDMIPREKLLEFAK